MHIAKWSEGKAHTTWLLWENRNRTGSF